MNISENFYLLCAWYFSFQIRRDLETHFSSMHGKMKKYKNMNDIE